MAVDRAFRSAEELALPAPLEHWRELRGQIQELVCALGYDAEFGSFVQVFGTKAFGAALLMIPFLAFLPADGPWVVGMVADVEMNLVVDGFVKRYHNQLSDDGRRVSEGAFLAHGFWLADNFALQNRIDDARAQFERVLRICNDVGLLSEQYDPVLKRQLHSCPQAFSKLFLINTAFNLNRATGPANQREKSAKFNQGRPEAGGALPDGADDRARP